MLRRALGLTAHWLGSAGCTAEVATCSGRAVLEACASTSNRCWCAAGPMGRHTFSSSSSSRGLTSLAQGPRTWASQTPVIGACRHQPSIWGVLHTRATLAAHPLPLHHDQQQQQRRGLFAARAKVKPNYQDHNQKKPPKIKLKTPSAAKRRFIVDKDGVMWRRQANRGSKRAKKNHRQLRALKAMVPVHSSLASKLRKMGYNRRWWFRNKA